MPAEHLGSPAGSPLDAVLFERRIVLVTGDVDHQRSTAIAAMLLTLDATGDDAIELRVSACRGGLHASLALLDVIDEVGVPVLADATGPVEGGPVLLLAAGGHRRISPHAVLHLREPDLEVAGSATDLERALAAHAHTRDAYLAALAARCRRPLQELDAEWARRATLTAADAVALGYADELLQRAAAPRD